MTTAKTGCFIGLDGGASSSKLILIDANDKVLAEFSSGSCNKNTIGFEQALKNVKDGIEGLFALSKRGKHDIVGVCMTTAGITTDSDKHEWKRALVDYLQCNANATLIEVHNDSVGNVASVCPQGMRGIVCIVGTGFIVCGYDGDPNIELRSGGWGPLFGDDASAYCMGEKVLKSAALYFDVCGAGGGDEAKEKEAQKQLHGGSSILYESVMQIANVTAFPDMVEWAYGARDKYMQVAQFAMVALQQYEHCAVAKSIVDSAVSALVVRLQIVIDKMYPKNKEQNKDDVIRVICGGSVMLKSALFSGLVEKQLLYEMGGDGRQTLIQFVKPTRSPQLGGALYVKHKQRQLSKKT